MDTYEILLKSHSGFRYLVFLLVCIALIQSLTGWLGQKPYTEVNRKINLFAMVSVHIQLLLGVILYFLSPLVMANDLSAAMKNDTARYWTAEHAVMMVIAAILFTLGYSSSKKLAGDLRKHRTVAVYYGLATIIVIVAILQSGRPLAGG